MGENHFATAPAALYGAVLLMAAFAYWPLQHLINVSQGANSMLKSAIGRDWKGKMSPILYLIGMAAAFRAPWIAQAVYFRVALLWFVPDRRIESTLSGR